LFFPISKFILSNKKPQVFSSVKYSGKAAVFTDGSGKPLDFGVLIMDSSIYAMLVCSEFRLAVLVIDRQGERTVEDIFWMTDEDFEAGVAAISGASGVRPSKQDTKVNSYAWSIAEKLDEGVRLRVTEAVDESDMTECLECGMMNPKGTPYCLECGCELE
jgi:hypothetical protein